MQVNIGIIGCGSISRYRHAPEYAQNKNCKIVAFSDPFLNRAEELAQSYSAAAYDDYKKIINDPSIDAVSVCTPNATHASIAIEALQAGKHVLCEKPMAINTSQAKAMMEAAKKSKKILMPAHNQRLFPAHKKVKELIDSGSLGEIFTFRASFKHKGPEVWSADHGNHTWFFDKNASFVGVMADLGVHKIDLIQWFLGEQITSVVASARTFDKRGSSGELIDVEDNSIILCNTDSGKTGIIETSWTNYGKEDNSTVIYFEKGVVKLYCDPEYDLIIEGKDGSVSCHKLVGVSTNDCQISSGIIDEFVDSIVNGKPAPITAEDGYYSIAVVEACVESANQSIWKEVSKL